MDCELYLLGFSLGGNFLMRWLGSHAKNRLENPDSSDPYLPSHVAAFAGVSLPFDVSTVGIHLKRVRMGLYNEFLYRMALWPYQGNNWKNQEQLVPQEVWKAAPRGIMDFDNETRAKVFGFKSAHEMYRAVSCGPVLGYVDRPFMVLVSDDDEICFKGQLPAVDILNNPFGMLVESEFGGHCQFFTDTGTKSRRYYPDIILKYFDGVSEFRSTSRN